MNQALKEIWKEVPSLSGFTSKKYAVSNCGGVASFTKSIKELYILKTHLNSGFPVISLTIDGKSKAIFIHHLVAEVFLKKRNHLCSQVIHLDYDKQNNKVANLKWVTRQERNNHAKLNPAFIKAISSKIHTGKMAKKLDEKTVIKLKKEIWNPKRKLTFKQLAEKYDIAEMNLYRIKSGEMWFHIHVEGEPLFPKYIAQQKNIGNKNVEEEQIKELKENKKDTTGNAVLSDEIKELKKLKKEKKLDKKEKKLLKKLKKEAKKLKKKSKKENIQK
jgi:uncharacterized protein (UPF0305 family)